MRLLYSADAVRTAGVLSSLTFLMCSFGFFQGLVIKEFYQACPVVFLDDIDNGRT